MKTKLFCSSTIVLIWLTAACGFVGRNAESSPVQNQQQPAAEARGSDGVRPSETAAAPPRVGTLFRGSIGDAKVEMDIKRDGENLSGSYYYLKSGSSNRLTLKGKVAADGTFTMQESDTAGKQTGTFKGKWKQEPNEAGATLEGEWLKPGQASEGLGFFAVEQMVYFTTTDITSREIKESVKAKKANLSAEYPELTGSAAGVAGFNQLAKARVMKSLADFKKQLAGVTAEDLARLDDMNNYIDIGYDVEYADDDLISVNFGEDTYSGGAHPNHGTFTITYDLKNGRELKLADLFKPGSKYLATIADYATTRSERTQRPRQR